MKRPGSTSERLVALFLLGVVALNPPLLSIFNSETLLFGFPVVYLYLFGVWGVLIVLLGVVASGAETEPEPMTPDPRDTAD